MSKTPKAPFANLHTLTDAQVFAAPKGHPFKRCESCGNSIISSACYCGECLRLTELGMAPAVKRFQPSSNTQQKHSYPAFDRSGYRDKIPATKFPAARKERV